MFGHIYVIAGRKSTDLNSIEKLSLADVAKGVAAWRLIEIDEVSFSPRSSMAVVALNCRLVVIFGGCKKGKKV